jgi:hypothetical protein
LPGRVGRLVWIWMFWPGHNPTPIDATISSHLLIVRSIPKMNHLNAPAYDIFRALSHQRGSIHQDDGRIGNVVKLSANQSAAAGEERFEQGTRVAAPHDCIPGYFVAFTTALK